MEYHSFNKEELSIHSALNPLRQKMKNYSEPQKVQELGLYPYFRVIESEQDTTVTIEGKPVLMFGSNSYLGLTNHPYIKEKVKEAVDTYGSGCAGSRFLNGNLDIHLELETRLANLVGKEAALVFSTGFQANLGIISSLLGRHDYLLLDSLNHASIIDGSRLSYARSLKFKHNDIQDLEIQLQKCDSNQIKLIIVDGIFSMEGDIADLPGITKLAEKYGASVMVDDAHALGVIGDGGSGSASYFNLNDRVDIIMGTFSKSLGSIGGFVASDNDTINYLKHHARSLIFSASISPMGAAAALAAMDIMKSEPERIENLWKNTNYSLKQLKGLGFDTGLSCTPIIPIYIRDNLKTFQLSKMLQDQGVFVNPITAPATDKDQTLIRFSLMATHTLDQIDEAIEKIYNTSKTLNII
jgi:8-amino-7-oxononanoate synthase